MFGILKQYIARKRNKRLRDWLYEKYQPAILCYNESDRFDPLSHLLIDLGETYMSIHYSDEVKTHFGISEEEFERLSKDVYDELFRGYSDLEDIENSSLYIR